MHSWRETPAEKLLVVYNNAPNVRALKIPLADTLLEGAHANYFGDCKPRLSAMK